MKKLNIKQFDEKERDIADALISLGVNRMSAMALAYLQDTNSATSTDLERAAGLRQPEVSLAMKQLMEHGCITKRDEKKAGKGDRLRYIRSRSGSMKLWHSLKGRMRRQLMTRRGSFRA